MRYIDTERQFTDIFTNPLILLYLLICGGKLMFAIRMAWFEGELVLFLVCCVFCFSLALSSYSPKSHCFTCYTSLYLLNYAYYCARMSSNEM
jgi:hypothetical protein